MITLVRQDSLFGVVIGPIFWAIYFVVSYVSSGIGCSLGYSNVQLLGTSVLQLLLLAEGAIIVGALAIAGAQAGRGRRLSQQSPEQPEDPVSQERHRFLYTITLILCGLSLVGTIWLVLASITAPVC